jgi:hypothetical protein
LNDPLDDKLQTLSQEQQDRFLVRTLLTVTRRNTQPLCLSGNLTTPYVTRSSKRGPRDHCRRRPPSSPVQALAKQRDAASGKQDSKRATQPAFRDPLAEIPFCPRGLPRAGPLAVPLLPLGLPLGLLPGVSSIPTSSSSN